MPKGYPGTCARTCGTVSGYGGGCRCQLCVQAMREHGKRHYRLHERVHRNCRLRNKYGISVDDFDSLVESQNGVCALCLQPPKGSWLRRLSIDHSHNTLVVRGLLCATCNRLLGWYERNKTAVDTYLLRGLQRAS